MPFTYSPRTLCEALETIPRRPGRGYRFVAADRTSVFYSYEDLHQEAQRRAAIMQEAGIQQGDRVALVCPDSDAFVLTFLAASLAGAIPVPIFPRATFKAIDGYVDVLEHIVTTAGAEFLVTQESTLPFVSKVSERKPSVRIVTAESFFAKDSARPFTTPTIKEEDICFLQFTSGSTSKPKGVMVRHRNLVANANAFLGPEGLDRADEDIGVSWLPLYHDMGLIGFVLGTLLCDIQTVLLPTASFARMPRLWLDTIHEYRGTLTYAPNFAYQLVSKRLRDKDVERLDLSCLRVAGCGAEPIRARALQAFAERLKPAGFNGDASFLPSYGMAEATLAISFHKLGTPLRIDRVSAAAMQEGKADVCSDADAAEDCLELVGCGGPFSGHEVVIRDKDGHPVPDRTVGHITTKGPSVTDGYFENEAATADNWLDGWLQTGDLGYFADGDLFICGRVKDLIIINGANHYPQDIEWAVADLEGVRRGNVAAVAVDSPTGEELIIIAEAPSTAAEALRGQIKSLVAERFGIAAREVAIVALGTLPKTSSGKTQRSKAKAMYEAGDLPIHG